MFIQQALQRPAILISYLIALTIAIAVHELGHAFVGWAMGDPTGIDHGKTTITVTDPSTRQRRRLTFLNPFKYFNLIGFLMFLIVGFGFLGQAPVNPSRMRNPRLGMTLAVAAGPLSNLATAVVFAIPWWLGMSYTGGTQLLPSIPEVLLWIINWNVLLCFFNLIPLYPLDGWTIVLGLLPTDLAYTWERYRMQSYYLFFILILISFINIPSFPDPLNLLISQPTNATVGFLTRLW